jgi:NAD(P)-dependent dehydrogenase (short-subunit alcohol dehydrogenase family)
MSILSSINDFLQALRGTNPTTLQDPIPAPTLTNKWIIITGSNNGVGLEASKLFAKWGANLILACRERTPSWEHSPSSAVETCKDLATAHGHSSTIEYWNLDLADFNSVEAFANRWILTGRVLDILVNNAGIAGDEGENTGDGFRVIYQVCLFFSFFLFFACFLGLWRNPFCNVHSKSRRSTSSPKPS